VYRTLVASANEVAADRDARQLAYGVRLCDDTFVSNVRYAEVRFF
jgi:hypothetical protein